MSQHVPHILSLDLGTSSLRASLVSPALTIRCQSRRTLQLKTGPDGKAEQDAEAILSAALNAIGEVIQQAQQAGLIVKALAFANAMASLVCLDQDHRPMRPALTYADLRAHHEADQLLAEYGRDFFCPTAAPVHASYWPPKLLWLHNQGLDLSDVHCFCTIKDLLVYRLTGRLITDESNAVATGMCDARRRDWDPRLLALAGVRRDQLPEIHPTTSVHPVQAGTALPAETPLVLGAMDGVLSSLGAGAFRPGKVTTMIGSSGAVRLAAQSPLTDDRARDIWSYPLDEAIWFRGAAMNSGGLVTRWLVRTFAKGDYDHFFQQAASISPGAEGLLFLPYLFGERAPVWDEKARGVFFGLHSGHTQAHFCRAGVEGILFALYSLYDLLQPPTGQIRATGGYLRSELMLQIQADLFGQPVYIPAHLEGSTLGAAALALKALGIIADYESLTAVLDVKQHVLPDLTVTPAYRAAFACFQQLYQQIQPVFDAH